MRLFWLGVVSVPVGAAAILLATLAIGKTYDLIASALEKRVTKHRLDTYAHIVDPGEFVSAPNLESRTRILAVVAQSPTLRAFNLVPGFEVLVARKHEALPPGDLDERIRLALVEHVEEIVKNKSEQKTDQSS